MESKPLKCKYCGADTTNYQYVHQISTSQCPHTFVLESLLGYDGKRLESDDFICVDHNEVFRIKYRLFLRKLEFEAMHIPRTKTKRKFETIYCTLCKTETNNYIRVKAIETTSLRNFVINEMNIHGKVTTRFSGTGVSESDSICKNCYFIVRKKSINVNYSPVKRKTVISAEQSSSAIKETEGTDILQNCVLCLSEKRDGTWMNVTALHRKWFLEIEKKGVWPDITIPSGPCRMHGKTGRKKCFEKLRKELRSSTVCCFCKKSLSPEKDVLLVTEEMSSNVEKWLNIKEVNISSSYYAELHKQCYEKLTDEIATIDFEVEDGSNADVIDREKLINDLMEDEIQKLIIREVPIHVKKLFDCVLKSFETFTEDLSISDPSEYELQKGLDKFCTKNMNFKIHQKSKKHGKLLYSEEWDIIYKCYELDLKEQNSEKERFDIEKKQSDTLATDFFFSIRKIREHIRKSSKLCELYSRYPEIIQSLKIEDILFTGVQINELTESSYIPPIDPLLFNMMFYITCTNKQAEFFEKTFDPTWGKVFLEGYTKKTKPFYSRILSCVFEILHQSNDNNTYPFQILFSDLIANTKPTQLMKLLNLQRKCASPNAYKTYKATMASRVKQCKSEGILLGLDEKLFTVVHLDNLEKYSKHSRDPSKALTSTLVVGAQQPQPKNSLMVLKENIDLHVGVYNNDSSDENVNISFNVPSDLDESNRFDCSQNSGIMTLTDDTLETSDSDILLSQESQNSDVLSSQSSDEHFSKEIKRRSSQRHNMIQDIVSPKITGIEMNPRIKRLKLDIQTEHFGTRKYVIPEYVEHVSRNCNIEDFVLTEKETKLIDELKMDVRVHALLQTEGSNYNEDFKQVVPSFKELEGWGQHVMPKTNTAYLDLIPGKPDTVDTLLYSLNLIKDLFVDRLGFRYVMVCGDGKTANLLYKIKDDYGKAMSWLEIMLGTWHLIKDYLGIFLTKYRSAFVETLLSKQLTKGNVDSIVACSVWEKSHNYTMWIMSALMRENVAKFMKYAESEDLDTTFLKELLAKAVKILSCEKITEKTVSEFNDVYRELKKLMISYSDDYDKFLDIGYKHDDQFALFLNALDDFHAYISAYISIRTGNWELRVASIKMMATRFMRSGAVVYKWLVLRHLADIKTYPESISDRLKSGAWVSCLKDGKGKCLARDEYHERTASKDIKCDMPKQLTKENMEIITNFSTYGATVRRNFINNFLIMEEEEKFNVSKGCVKNWLSLQETRIEQFKKLFENEDPFSVRNRELKKPFTTNVVKENFKLDYIGRRKFGEPFNDVGKTILTSLAISRFCNEHNVNTEKKRMSKKGLILFPKEKKSTKSSNSMKEKEKAMEILAAGIVKLASGDTNQKEKFTQLQLSNIPLLFASIDGVQNRKQTKTNIRTAIEDQYHEAFIKCKICYNNSLFIRDSMQDIMLQPLKNIIVFKDYFELFWDVKVKNSFSESSCVILDFDTQTRRMSVPKDGLRAVRDEKNSKICDIVPVSDDEIIPVSGGDWISFLANRENKRNLVLYLCSKLENVNYRLENGQTLLISYEGKVLQVTNKETKNLPYLVNTHDESDTRIFFLCSFFESKDCIIKSTDSDILFNALLNNNKLSLEKRNVLLQYSSTGSLNTQYCSLNILVDSINNDPNYAIISQRSMSPAKYIGFLHFLTGSDDISFLNGFSKKYCLTNFVKFNSEICPFDYEEYVLFFDGNLESMILFFSRFLITMYCKKFNSCFDPGEMETYLFENDRESTFDKIRQSTWHKTVVSSNQLPSTSAIDLHCKRLCYVMKKNGNATSADIELNAIEYGWKYTEIEGVNVLTPEWDSNESKNKLNMLREEFLQRCGCKKSKCQTKGCKCKRLGKVCTQLCSCINCGNDHSPDNNESEGDTDNEDKNDDFESIEFENKDSDYEENNSDYDLS